MFLFTAKSSMRVLVTTTLFTVDRIDSRCDGGPENSSVATGGCVVCGEGHHRRQNGQK